MSDVPSTALSRSAVILAAEPWNDTGITLEAGRACDLRATGEWIDWRRRSGPEGRSGNILMRVFERWRRAPDRPWFELTGCIDRDLATRFHIGRERTGFVPDRSGRLYCFANDVPWAYGNNSGSVVLTVTPLSGA